MEINYSTPANSIFPHLDFCSGGRKLPVAVENSQESLPELPVHKTISYGVAAGADVREELHQRNPGGAHVFVHCFGVKEVPGVQNVEGRPTDEKFCYYHEEHPDYLEWELNDFLIKILIE